MQFLQCICTRPHHQSYESSASYLSHSSWLICCFWHYWSLHSSRTSVILVWNHFICSILDKFILAQLLFLGKHWRFKIIFLPTLIWCSSRIRSWSSFHSIYYSSQLVKSDSSSRHKLYADDTQLYYSRLLTSDTIFLILNKLHVYDWMSSNFLSLNPSKTEFLDIGLPKQLEQLNHPTIHLPNDVILSPVDSARNLGVIFDSNLTFFWSYFCCV